MTKGITISNFLCKISFHFLMPEGTECDSKIWLWRIKTIQVQKTEIYNSDIKLTLFYQVIRQHESCQPDKQNQSARTFNPNWQKKKPKKQQKPAMVVVWKRYKYNAMQNMHVFWQKWWKVQTSKRKQHFNWLKKSKGICCCRSWCQFEPQTWYWVLSCQKQEYWRYTHNTSSKGYNSI